MQTDLNQLKGNEKCTFPAASGPWTQSRNLPTCTYFFSFWAFAALAKAFTGNEFGLNPRGYGLDSGRDAPLGIL